MVPQLGQALKALILERREPLHDDQARASRMVYMRAGYTNFGLLAGESWKPHWYGYLC